MRPRIFRFGRIVFSDPRKRQRVDGSQRAAPTEEWPPAAEPERVHEQETIHLQVDIVEYV